MLRRRDLFAAVGGAVVARALPVAAAQGMPTLGVMMSVSRDAPSSQARLKAFRDGLQAHGWIEGKTIRIEYRWVEGQGIGDSANQHLIVDCEFFPDVQSYSGLSHIILQ